MKRPKEHNEMNELRAQIVESDAEIRQINVEIIAIHPVEPRLRLIIQERRLISERNRLKIRLHNLENRLIDLGRGPIYGIHRVPQIKTNQYSN